ncbi:hypothetical protein GCM10023212_34100 [Luteolibacter yonseiensis]
MREKLVISLLGFFLTAPVFGAPVISEFMADNESTVQDENGEFSDWLEIHNPDATPVALADWYLTDNASNLTKWRFPAVTLQPGQFLLVWASSKNRRTPGSPLHTNFSLSKDGEFLGLVKPDGVTVAHSYSPKFPAQLGDEAYGLRFQTTTLLPAGTAGKYQVPTAAGVPAENWNQPGFVDSSWAGGQSGYGFGLSVPGITVRQVAKNGGIGGLVDALNLASLPENDPQVLRTDKGIYPVVNFLGAGSEGRYGNNESLPSGENYVVVATGTLTIPTAGTYTFGLNSDDGGRILIDGVEIMRDDTFHGPQDFFGTIGLAAGPHTFEAVMFQGTGGDCVEFFAAPGQRTSFDSSAFRLVGDVANGGLAVTTTPADANGLVRTNMQGSLAGGKTSAYFRLPFSTTGPGTATALSLVMRYNDGFSAWLNGQPVAAANAPSPLLWNSAATAVRSNAQTLRRQGFDLTASLPSLANGQNLLAIQGLNASTGAGDFLVLPELVAGSLDATAGPAIYGEGTATPGWLNGQPSSLGNVAPLAFGRVRGIFTTGFSLPITCATPGAVIRYTTDGSTPSATNGTLYSGPLTISKTTVVRAVATIPGWRSAPVDTHSYVFPADVLVQSPTGAAPPGWPSSSGTSQIMDYGMDPDIVNNGNPDIGGPATVRAALLALPSVMVTTDLPNLLNIGGSQGIYSNPGNRGLAWERAASLEWINPPNAENPNGTSEFQITGGMRVRGGFSRSTDNPKHALRFIFRDEYGAGKLNYPLFGRDAAQEFDKIDLRTAQNYSWSFEGNDQNTFLREESCRQAQLDMGQPGSHVRYFHLYLNGVYWGIYDLDERTEAAFSESYLGGDQDDYDVVKAESDADFVTVATDGNLVAWQDLFTKAKATRASPTNANYFKLMGLAADGVTTTSDPVLLDVDNLIDYNLMTFWSGNLDGCVSNFLGNNRANNWSGSRRRDGNPRKGFQFFVHDFEHTLLNVNEDRTGPYTNNEIESNVSYYNPLYIHQDLISNVEYKMRWADRVHRHLFNNGALTPEAWQNRINKLAAFVDPAIAAESARWGDSKTHPPRTRQNWINAQNTLISYLTPRNGIVLGQLRADGLYPSLDAPVLSPYGGYQPSGVEVAVQGPPSATLHYMADGSDPRAVGGALRSGALTYTASTTSEDLVPWSASGWKYQGNGSDLGTAWRNDGYNDSSWPTGTAELGYGDNDEATVVTYPGPLKPATCYFRRTFSVTDPDSITSLALTVEYDDAYAVYLNGNRIAGNLPTNPAYNYYTGNPIEDTITPPIAIPPGALRAGGNTLAVEIHQSGDGSSDLSMNLSLVATRSTTSTPLVLTGTGPRTVRFRAKNGSTWSALSESTYQLGTTAPTPANLVVSEISYFPPPPDGDAEFIELYNPGTTTVDLAGARFTDGIDFTFPAASTLAPGGRVLIVQNIAAFQSKHGTGKPISGIFQNETALSNTGEHLRLETPSGGVLLDFSYGIDFPWPSPATGHSMILLNPADPENPLSWRPSAQLNGNPGSGDSFTRPPGQSLLDYALSQPGPALDTTGNFTVTRRLGADDATLVPEWSTDLIEWKTNALTFTAETPNSSGTSKLTWKLDPLPEEKTFIRLRVVEK